MPSAVARAACVLGLRSSSDLSSGHRPSTSSTPARHNRHYHCDQHRLLRYRGCRQRKFELAPACTRLRIHRSRRSIDHRLVLPRPTRTRGCCPRRRHRPQSWLVELASRGRWYGWSVSPSGNRRSHHQGAQTRGQIDTDGASADRRMDHRRSIRSCLSAPLTGRSNQYDGPRAQQQGSGKKSCPRAEPRAADTSRPPPSALATPSSVPTSCET